MDLEAQQPGLTQAQAAEPKFQQGNRTGEEPKEGQQVKYRRVGNEKRGEIALAEAPDADGQSKQAKL